MIVGVCLMTSTYCNGMKVVSSEMYSLLDALWDGGF